MDLTADAKSVDLDGDGTAESGTKMAYVMYAIDSMDISDEKKDSIFRTEYPEASLDKTPWHGAPSWWEYHEEYPDGKLTPSEYTRYVEKVQSIGISPEVYSDYLDKISGKSKKEQILPVINSLPISKKQKDAMYRLNGWAESKLKEAPWH